MKGTKCTVSYGDKIYLQRVLNNLELTLLYRGSRDGWEAVDFHSRCDDKGPTIILLQILNGDCIGGFTNVSWSYYNYTDKRNHLDNSAFLFNLTRKRQFYNKLQNYRPIKNHRNFGPIFGVTDFMIIPPFNSGYALHTRTNKIYFQIPVIDGIN